MRNLSVEEEKKAHQAIKIAERCGVPYGYSVRFIQEYDMSRASIGSAAAGLMRQYNSQYATRETPVVVNWSTFRRMFK